MEDLYVNTSKDIIEYLDKLEAGSFLTINIPIFREEISPITVMYMGKDDEGRYNFADTGRFILSKEFIEKGKITLDKNFNEDEAFEIYQKTIMPHRIKQNKKKDLSR